MRISGPGGVDPSQNAELASDGPATQPDALVSSVASLGPLRGTGTSVPPAVLSAVRDYEAQHGVARDIPDLSYGAVVSASPADEGKWTVTMGSFPTTIAGPLPGMDRTPRDVRTYTVDPGGNDVDGDPVVVPADAPPATDDTQAAEDAASVEDPLGDRNDENDTAAVKSAIDVAGDLVKLRLGFPDIADQPAERVDRFKTLLDHLEADGKLGDLKDAADNVNRLELDRFGGRRPMDWYGSKELLGALVNRFGTDSQKAAWNPPPPPSADTPGVDEAHDVEHLLGDSSSDQKNVTKACMDLVKNLMLPSFGFPRMKDPLPADDAAKVQGFLSTLEADGRLRDVASAVQAQETRERNALGGGMIPDWFGPMAVMDTVVDKLGTDSQKQAWQLERTPVLGLGAGGPAVGPSS